MSIPRSEFNRRRLLRISVVSLVCALLAWWVWWMERDLSRSSYATGYVMYAAVITMALYGVRKKLPGIPLASSANWLQLHIYLGLGSAVLFALHIGWTKKGLHWPDGWLEGMLATAYVTSFLSGLWGLWLSRTLPRQLARTSDQIIFERIPMLRYGILRKARQTVLTAVESSGAETLANFYVDHIDPYLAAPRSLAYAIRPSSRRRRMLMSELADLRRLLNDAECEASETLFALVRRKDDVDFHHARQGLLKGWLFVHLTLTWALILFASLHGVMALSMQGGPA